jgi:hypothetical protein
MSDELEKAKFEQETKDRERELALREREVRLKEEEAKKPPWRPWRDPVFVALIGAILALLGNIYSSRSNARVAADASKLNAQLASYTSRRNALLQSIIEVIHSDPEKAEAKLDILLKTKVIEDDDHIVADALASGLFKTLAAKPVSQVTSPPPIEAQIGQQEILVEHGGYAQASDPPCAQFNDPAALSEKFANQQPGSVLLSPTQDRGPTCAAVRITIPAGKKITKIVAEAREQEQPSWTPCQVLDGPWRICGVGWSAWNFMQEGNSVTGIFKNWSHDRSRDARIVVYGQ